MELSQADPGQGTTGSQDRGLEQIGPFWATFGRGMALPTLDLSLSAARTVRQYTSLGLSHLVYGLWYSSPSKSYTDTLFYLLHIPYRKSKLNMVNIGTFLLFHPLLICDFSFQFG